MKERVTTRLGTVPVLFVAPHGHDLDDVNTGVIALAAAAHLDAHAVVNNSWRRSAVVDEIRSQANCNNFDHCQEAVVKAEFYDPVMKAIDAMTEPDPFDGADAFISCYVFMIHGVGDGVRAKTGHPELDLIVGFGAGDKPRYTCSKWRREFFIDAHRLLGLNVFEGGPGGAYSAWSKTNLTQAVRRETGDNVHVLQLEYVYSQRGSDLAAQHVAAQLAKVAEGMLKATKYSRPDVMPAPGQV